MKKIDGLVILFIIFASLFTLKDLFRPFFYTSHDGPHQVVRLYYFDKTIREGQVPPRWVGELLNGFGYPLFNFSYHFPWFIAEPFVMVGFSIFEAIKITFLIGFILSGLTMYIFQKELFGRLGAFVGTIIYLYAPYRFSNIFVRAAIGDATTFIFPPLLFLSLYKLKSEEKINWVWIAIGAIALTGILLSHAMVFLFFFISVIAYIAYFLFFIRQKKRFLANSFFVFALGFGLSAYYFFPSLIERGYTKFGEIMSSAYLGNTFLDIKKLLYSGWGYGTVDAKEGAMSLQLGIAQWIVIGLVVFIIFLEMIRKKINQEIFFYFVLFWLTIFAMLPFSLPLWKIITKFAFVDFTWRVLAVTIFSVSVLAGFLISNIKFRYFVGFFIIFLAFYSNRNHLRINQILDWPLSFYLQLEKTTNSFDEYTPKWIDKRLIAEVKPKVEFLENDGSAEINILKNKSNLLEFSLYSPKEGKVRVNTIYYPGWKMWIDGKENKIDYSNGLVEFAMDKGRKKVVLYFLETPFRLISNMISLISFNILLFLFFVRFKEKHLK